jgi:hypothetical protein
MSDKNISPPLIININKLYEYKLKNSNDSTYDSIREHESAMKSKKKIIIVGTIVSIVLIILIILMLFDVFKFNFVIMISICVLSIFYVVYSKSKYEDYKKERDYNIRVAYRLLDPEIEANMKKKKNNDAYNENIKKQEETIKYITERTSTAINGLVSLVNKDPDNTTLNEKVKKYIDENMPTHQDQNWIVAKEIYKNTKIPDDIKKYILSEIGEYNGTLH